MVLLFAAVVEDYLGNPDVHEYQCYANDFWYGAQAIQAIPASQCQSHTQISQYHSFPLEYPPSALIAFSPPLLGAVADYPALFALWMGVMVAMIYWLLLRYGPRKAATFFTIGLLVGCQATSLARFDMFPAALTLLCLILAEHRHWTLAYIALALGVLIKAYPIALFPLLFLAEQREQAGFFVPEQSQPLKMLPGVLLQTIRNLRNWHWKNALIFTGLVAGVTACFWGLSHQGAFAWFFYLYQRPFEVESTGSVLLWLASLVGVPVIWVTSFGSWNILSPIAGALSQGLVILFASGYLYIVIQQWRGKMGLFQACLAALMLMIASGKVFSPQYLLWLMPLLAISAPGNRRLWLAWVGICCLTTLLYPVYYGIINYNHASSQIPGFLPTILLRDGLFVALMLAYLFNFRHLREPDVM
jgi:hypothetical protein